MCCASLQIKYIARMKAGYTWAHYSKYLTANSSTGRVQQHVVGAQMRDLCLL